MNTDRNSQDIDANSLGAPSSSRRALGAAILGASAGLLVARQASAKSRKDNPLSAYGGTAQDHLDIEQLLFSYAAALDKLDAAEMKACFAPGAKLWGGGLKLRDDFVDDLMHQVTQAGFIFTQHFVFNPLYTIDGDTAVGTAYGIATMILSKDGVQVQRDSYHRYHDRLVKRDGRWMLFDRQYEPVFRTADLPLERFTADVSSRPQPSKPE